MGTTAENEINHRKAIAGVNMLKGDSQFQALTKAGYAPTTARVPAANGLSAKQCIKEAKKLDPALDPASLLHDARAALKAKLNDPKIIQDAKLGEVGKVLDVCERWYGAHATDPKDDARDFHQRLTWLRELGRLEASSAATAGQTVDISTTQPDATPCRSAAEDMSSGKLGDVER